MDFFSKCDQIRRKLRIWSHLLKKSLMKNFFFCEMCKSFRNAGQDSTEKLKINFNASYNLKQKTTHSIIIRGKTRVYLQNSYNKTNRMNTELVNSQTFNNNRMVNDKYQPSHLQERREKI